MNYEQSENQDIDIRGSSCIHVYARFRPLNDIERNECGENSDVSFDDHKVTISSSQQARQFQHYFTFDRVFNTTTSQQEIYQSIAYNIVEESIKGYNCSILAYGQTGSGKTYSILGNPSNNEHDGIAPRLVSHLFDTINKNENNQQQYSFKISCIEIYDEKIYDLLHPCRQIRNIRENMDGPYIQDCTEKTVTSSSEMMKYIIIGSSTRHIQSTHMNIQSSRSHLIITISLSQSLDNNDKVSSNKDGETDVSCRYSRLVLVDLAGSERCGKSQISRGQMKIHNSINKSLFTLASVIQSLVRQESHIPYRDSRLTFLLSSSLGGNSKSSLLITLSPSRYNTDETLSTLRFGSLASKVTNYPIVNQKLSLDKYKQELIQAKRLHIEDQNQILELENQLKEVKKSLYQPTLNISHIDCQHNINKLKEELRQSNLQYLQLKQEVDHYRILLSENNQPQIYQKLSQYTSNHILDNKNIISHHSLNESNISKDHDKVLDVEITKGNRMNKRHLKRLRLETESPSRLDLSYPTPSHNHSPILSPLPLEKSSFSTLSDSNVSINDNIVDENQELLEEINHQIKRYVEDNNVSYSPNYADRYMNLEREENSSPHYQHQEKVMKIDKEEKNEFYQTINNQSQLIDELQSHLSTAYQNYNREYESFEQERQQYQESINRLKEMLLSSSSSVTT